MAGLFSMPSPEMVRASARQGLFKQAAQVANAPRGRGMVQAAAQAGGLFGEAIGRAAGGMAPGEAEAMKFQEVQAQITEKYQGVDLSDPRNQIKMMGETAKLLGAAGFQAQAVQAMDMANQIRQTIPETKVADIFAPVYDDAGNIVAQRNLRTNKVVTDPRAPKDPDTVINNNLGDQDELAKSLSKEFGKDFVQRRKDATDAKHSLQSANTAVDLLNSGVITGTGAQFITGLGKALNRIGFDVGKDAIANTEAFYANQAKQVAQIIKAFGAGTGLSDADREYAERAAAGKITMNEDSIRRIIDINARASRNVIEEFNADVAKLPQGTVPFPLEIEVPQFKGAQPPGEDVLTEEEKAELERLRKGQK